MVSFALCIDRDATAGDLHLATLYRVVSDRSAAQKGMLRVVDDSGDDYLYPRAWFVLRRLPASLDRKLAKARGASV